MNEDQSRGAFAQNPGSHAGRAGAALPLAGVRVLELGHIVAGPTAGQILGDMGADVIKVESVDGGDQARNMPGSTRAMFHFLNRNKRSVALDLKGEGKAVFINLVRTADIVVDNFAYGVVDRLGIGYKDAAAVQPGLIWLSIKGFLPGGPSESQPLLDELAQMAGGLAFMTGTPDKPMRAGASIVDIGAASYGVIAVLGALRQREQQGGRGQHISAGLFETSVYWVAQWMASSQFSGEPSVPMVQLAQGSRMGFGVYSLFTTVDGARVFVGVISDRHWERFCEVFEMADLHDDPRFKERANRVHNKHELAPIVSDLIARHTLADVLDRLSRAAVPCAPVRRPDELADDPHLLASGHLMEHPLPNGKMGRLPKLPFRATGFAMSMRRPVPELGQDTAAILAEMGYTDSAIAGLRERGAIGGK